MTPGVLQTELKNIGKKLSKWQAELKTVFWIAIIMACLWMSGLSDLFIRFERPGRMIIWFVFLVLIGENRLTMTISIV